mmetsp:Transcript_2790/g.9305  ORF Transcript_2790/g.9305 Transcript_2790/m.9305 type:complete len:270 (-) Transcript_2790:370-1179(-)
MTPLSVQRRGGGTTMRHGAPSSRGEGVLAQSSPSLCGGDGGDSTRQRGGDGGESTRQAVRRSGRPRRQRCIRAALYSRRRSRRGGGVCHQSTTTRASSAALRPASRPARPPPQLSVGRDAAREDERVWRAAERVALLREEAEGIRQPHLEVAQRRVLKGGRHAGAEGGRGALLLARPLDGESHRRLEPGKRKVEGGLVPHRHRERRRRRVALPRERLEGGASSAADGQLEQPRHLVVRLAESVVQSRADYLVVSNPAGEEELAVAARGE